MSIQEQKRYDKVYQNRDYAIPEASQGKRFVNLIYRTLGSKVKTILDVGCGPGHSIREFDKKGYMAAGVETSEFLIKNDLKDLVSKNRVFKMEASDLKFKDNFFDLVFCTDVMEHIPLEEVDKCIKEICRVSKKYIFFSISSGPSDFTEDGKDLHITIRSRKWWIREIERAGNVKLIAPKFPWNLLVNNKTIRFNLFKKRDYFLFEKCRI